MKNQQYGTNKRGKCHCKQTINSIVQKSYVYPEPLIVQDMFLLIDIVGNVNIEIHDAAKSEY